MCSKESLVPLAHATFCRMAGTFIKFKINVCILIHFDQITKKYNIKNRLQKAIKGISEKSLTNFEKIKVTKFTVLRKVIRFNSGIR